MASLFAGESAARVAAIIVEQGKLLDFIDGKTQRTETPEEYVRQEISKSLVREYRYAKADIAIEFTIRVGSRKPRADITSLSILRQHILRRYPCRWYLTTSWPTSTGEST